MGLISNRSARRARPSRLFDHSGSGTHPRPERMGVHWYEKSPKSPIGNCFCGRSKYSPIHKLVTDADTVIRDSLEILHEARDLASDIGAYGDPGTPGT